MLKTALKPRWIAALVLALAVSTIFVVLSQWQFSRSTETVEQPKVTTEEPKPLLEVIQPGEPVSSLNADQVVTLSGRFDPSKQVLVPGRLQENRSGYWVVDAFVVDGAPAMVGVQATTQTAIPVARGWVAEPQDAPEAPSGQIQLQGRLLPAEAPLLNKNLPPGQVAAVATADLVNRWQLSSYRAFLVASQEVNSQGADVAATASGPLEPIVVGPQPVVSNFNWLNIFYAIEWVVFAGFAVFLWWRLVADDYRREQEAAEDEALEAASDAASQQEKRE